MKQPKYYIKNCFTFLILLNCLFICSYNFTYADAVRTIYGKVKDNKTKNTLPGAKIKIEEKGVDNKLILSKRGTFANAKGEFKLPLEKNDKSIKVYSIGYKTKTINISELNDTIDIFLDLEPIQTATANVTAKIEVNEIIKRAIQKRQENIDKLKTFQGNLYSKLTIELDGSIFDAAETNTNVSGNSIGISSNFGSNNDAEKEKRQLEKNKMFILETFSENFKDYEQNIDKSYIKQRRQTANLKPQDNLLVLSKFVNFYEDEMNVINTKIVSPLSENALNYYKFKLIDRKQLDDRFIYIIEVISDTKLFPTFNGTLSIVEGTYNLVELKLQPSDETAIQFFKHLTYIQNYEEFDGGVWYPTLLETSARAKINFVKGILDVGADVNVTSIYNDVKINKSLPDSIYNKEIARIITAPYADSNKIEFWEKNSLRSISQKELDIYNKIDSLAQLDSNDTNKENDNFSLNFLPISDFNRVAGYELGLDFTTGIYNTIDIYTKASYSIGQKKFYGEAGFGFEIYNSKSFTSKITANYISQIATSNYVRPYARAVNSFFAITNYSDFYDYFHNEGYEIKLDNTYKFLNFKLIFQDTRNNNLFRTSDDNLFASKEQKSGNTLNWRKLDYMNNNDLVIEGRFRKLIGKFDFFEDSYRAKGDDLDYKFGFHGMLLENVSNNENDNLLSSYQLKANLYFPLIFTGYEPISLELHTTFSKTENNMPTQYLFRLPTSVGFISSDFAFLTAPLGYFGGYETQVYGAKLNTSDLLWRAIGLPTYEGRGIELTFSAMTGRAFNNIEKSYISTNGQYFSEIGFGFHRIPLFITDIVYLGFDMRFGLGPIKEENIGVAFNLSTPF